MKQCVICNTVGCWHDYKPTTAPVIAAACAYLFSELEASCITKTSPSNASCANDPEEARLIHQSSIRLLMPTRTETITIRNKSTLAPTLSGNIITGSRQYQTRLCTRNILPLVLGNSPKHGTELKIP